MYRIRRVECQYFVFFFVFLILILNAFSAFSVEDKSHSVYDIQKELSLKGYSVGAVDGTMGPKTRQALKKFQEDNGLNISGTLDIGTENILFKATPEPGSTFANDRVSSGPYASSSKAEMSHTPPEYFIPANRIQVDVNIKDPAGIDRARCYFKAAGEADFVFVAMMHTGGSDRGYSYSAILPAPSSSTGQIQYLFLAVNKANEIVKSRPFLMNRDLTVGLPAWQNIDKEKNVTVSMELDQVPSGLPGFSDNIVMNKVESGLRFGMVAGGLYTSEKAAGASDLAASATSGCTVTAGAGETGFSAGVLIGAGVAGAAAVAGTAAALSGGGGGDGDSSTIAGNWNFSLSCDPYTEVYPGGTITVTVTGTGTYTFNVNGQFSYSGVNTGITVTDAGLYSTEEIPVSGKGQWSLAGNTLTLIHDGGETEQYFATGKNNFVSTYPQPGGWTCISVLSR